MVESNSHAHSAEPPALGSALLAGTVTRVVGPTRLKYYVHKILLVHHSEYFRNALKWPWKEAKEGVIILEDVESAVGTYSGHALHIWRHSNLVQSTPSCTGSISKTYRGSLPLMGHRNWRSGARP
jgi:hypothetical protein